MSAVLHRPDGYAAWPREQQDAWYRENVEQAERPPAYSDDALALRFADRHADDLRFVAVWGKWLHWNGSRWRFDNTLQAYDMVRAICREASIECNERAGIKAAIASAKTVAAVERLARADRRIAATTDQWDADPWQLNTPGGVIDLRTGKKSSATPAGYMTKITAADPDGGCPRFLGFLHRITGGDSELIAYLQRVLRYALSGMTREHALFFAYGTGANGKSVLLSTVAGIMADYHCTAPIETFVASNSDRHPTDLAGLNGARLVTASETEEGRKWAEAKIKQLTGGDTVRARFMRQDFFDFTPTFKLLIAGNHKPALRSVDEAIKRRFHLIPFAVTIPAAERDPNLTEKLKAEWPGILRWIIDGCLRWQREGLQPPPAVLSATADYLESEDAFAAWIDERCARDPQAKTSVSALYGSWVDWATTSGEAAGTMRRFSQTLEQRGFLKSRSNSGAQFAGLTIKPISSATPGWERGE